MARMDMDENFKKIGPTFSSFNAMSAKKDLKHNYNHWWCFLVKFA